MLYILDDELGRIDICELLEYDSYHIKQLLRAERQRTENPNIQARSRRLAAELEPQTDYELAWADVFLISSLLLNESVETNNPEIELLLSRFEAAARNIITQTE